MPVYFAGIPLERLRRFSQSFHPENSPGGDEVVSAIMRRWRSGDFFKIWVYPSGDQFIVSDDYFTLAAAEIGRPDFLPCWVLGTVPTAHAIDIQGPCPVEWVKETLLPTGGSPA